MEKQNISVQYSAKITDIVSVNSSFDRGELWIAYEGKNRNGSFISKRAFEKSAPTLAYCPVVVNYDIEEEHFGGHDVELTNTDDGVQMLNMTDPVGVVPKETQPWFQIVEEENGDKNEYFCTDVLLWKRQPAYQKIKKDGIVAQSMEITVKDGRMDDGIYYIDDFEFTALTLLNGDEDKPCFESAALHMFGLDKFKEQYTAMMEEFKNSFAMVQPSAVDVRNTSQAEGGKKDLNEKMDLLQEFCLNAEDLDFSIDDFTVEELRTKFEEMKAGEPAPSSDPEPASAFSLTGEQLVSEIMESLRAVKMTTEWGDEWPRYWYTDYSLDPAEVYFNDCEDWHLYGAPFSMNGDHVVIDFEAKKRKKVAFVDFDGGEQTAYFSLKEFAEAVMAGTQAKAQAQFSAEKEQLQAQVESLNAFKLQKEREERDAAEAAVFAKFPDLEEIQEFSDLRANCSEMALDALEEKCYAIRGRNQKVNFSVEPEKAQKLPVERLNASDEPYGGAYSKYLNK